MAVATTDAIQFARLSLDERAGRFPFPAECASGKTGSVNPAGTSTKTWKTERERETEIEDHPELGGKLHRP